MANRLETHQKDYKEGAWTNYTLSELGNFVHLFGKRSEHRSNKDKAIKDLYDAKNYLFMMAQKLIALGNSLNIDYEEL